MNRFFILLLVFVALAAALLPVVPVSAANLSDAFKPAYLGQVAGDEGAGYNTNAKAETLIGQVINIALSFVGIIFLVLMIYGGYLWMTARGNDSQVGKAKDLIGAAIIGLIIVVSAYVITYFVVEQVTRGTLQPENRGSDTQQNGTTP